MSGKGDGLPFPLVVYGSEPPPEPSMFVAFVVVVVAVVAWFIAAYNGLIALKNQVLNAWKQIDVQLKRRHDLVPNLVNTVKGAMQHERDTLEAVMAARNQAVRLMSGGAPNSGQLAAEGQLTTALGRLMATVEAYPDLKGLASVGQLQEELTSTENKIAFARQLYNDVTTTYNTRQMQFPASLVASTAGAQPAPLWEITDGAERAVPGVDLSYQRGAPVKPTA
ncbi:MAG: hypothetical protein NVS1B4_05210 [Gemmatimonadaceae bacterium]